MPAKTKTIAEVLQNFIFASLTKLVSKYKAISSYERDYTHTALSSESNFVPFASLRCWYIANPFLSGGDVSPGSAYRTATLFRVDPYLRCGAISWALGLSSTRRGICVDQGS